MPIGARGQLRLRVCVHVVCTWMSHRRGELSPWGHRTHSVAQPHGAELSFWFRLLFT